MPIWAMYIRSINMENQNAIVVNNADTLLAEFTGGTSGSVEMMIGVGLVKDSDAVFFQYLGDDQKPVALMKQDSGKPITRLTNVTLCGLSIAEDIGEFKSTKLNIYLRSSAGRTIMLTSGLTTIWSQCLLTCLSGLYNSYDLDTAFNLDSWKGNSKMRPCFASVRIGQQKVTDQDLYNKLTEARGDRNVQLTNDLLREVVARVGGAVNPQVAEVSVEEAPQVDSEAAEIF
jgi:hypothetical protein